MVRFGNKLGQLVIGCNVLQRFEKVDEFGHDICKRAGDSKKGASEAEQSLFLPEAESDDADARRTKKSSMETPAALR